MAKLWQKNYELDSLIEDFTVGKDYLLDMSLVKSDCVSSIAHATMLNSIGILSEDELEKLINSLRKIIDDVDKGAFVINKSDEDCHTAIESRLTLENGEAGKKIHTGRSRNDQVTTCTRVYSKAFVLKLLDKLTNLVDTILDFAEKNMSVPMPGRTHLQIAMPSSVGLWSSSFAEEIIDHIKLLKSLYEIIDSCPLGSAASYGVPLNLDREMTAKLLGFSKVQNNVLYVNNSRGKYEAMLINVAEDISLTFSKIATDLILFSLPEFSYFSLPDKLCSGSSIMPQKKNPDGLELMRAKSAVISGYATTMKSILRSLPTGYNRDYQDTKEPFIRSSNLIVQCVDIIDLTFRELQVNEESLRKGFASEIFATDEALKLVANGMSFRDAYKQVGLNLDKLSEYSIDEVLESRKSLGTTGNLNLEYGKKELNTLEKDVEAKREKFYQAISSLAGKEIQLF